MGAFKFKNQFVFAFPGFGSQNIKSFQKSNDLLRRHSLLTPPFSEMTIADTAASDSTPSTNAQGDSPCKRHRSTNGIEMAIAIETAGNPNPGALAAIQTKRQKQEAAEHDYSRLDSKLEEMLQDLKLDEVSAAADRKETNEEICPIYKLSNDELKHIFGFVGEMQYRFVACTSDRFHEVYLETVDNEKETSIESAAASVSCAKLFLGTENQDVNTRAKRLFFIAARDGNLKVLKWGQDAGYKLKFVLGQNAIANAALNGHLEVVIYLRKLRIRWNAKTCENAATNGHLNVVKWARANGCLWDEWTCSNAAANGHLNVLQWANLNQCPWDKGTCTRAAVNGHLNVLKWARANGCPWDEWTCTNAAMNGHLNVLKWARANKFPWDECTCNRAATHGHLNLLKWARANGCPWNKHVCSNAAMNGHLNVLKWARANGCPWDESTCSNAAGSGHFEMLKWAKANGCPWDSATCACAAMNGNLEMLKWARENQCPWGKATCSNAAMFGHLNVLKWARSNGCP